jgi:hypothetical protein
MVDPLDAHVRILPGRGHVRPADDLILASLVDEEVAQLKAHREDPDRRRYTAAGFFSGFGLAIGSDYRCEVIAREKPIDLESWSE